MEAFLYFAFHLYIPRLYPRNHARHRQLPLPRRPTRPGALQAAPPRQECPWDASNGRRRTSPGGREAEAVLGRCATEKTVTGRSGSGAEPQRRSKSEAEESLTLGGKLALRSFWVCVAVRHYLLLLTVNARVRASSVPVNNLMHLRVIRPGRKSHSLTLLVPNCFVNGNRVVPKAFIIHFTDPPSVGILGP